MERAHRGHSVPVVRENLHQDQIATNSLFPFLRKQGRVVTSQGEPVMASRLDRLRACGNGVVPLVAAYAFVSLWACLWEE